MVSDISCCDKQEVSCRASLNLSRLRYGCQRFSRSSPALPCHALHLLRLLTKCTRTFNFWEIFKRAFKIYGIWLQAQSVVYTQSAQCSSASVGLAQARPNNLIIEIKNGHMTGINYIVLCILFILLGLKITDPVDCVCIYKISSN